MTRCMSMIVYMIGIFVLMALPLPILPILNAGQEIIRIDEHFTESRTVYHFFQPDKIVELTLSGAIDLFGNRSLVRVILVGDNLQEYLVYEAYPLIVEGLSMRIISACEETCSMEGIVPKLLKIELINSSIQIE